MTFQLVLATDGETSIAILIYQNFDITRSIVTSSLSKGAIGFDAGDQDRSATVFAADRTTFSLKTFNVFRIDGEQ